MPREKSARITLRPNWWDKIEPFEYTSDGSPLGDETKRVVDEIVRTSRAKTKQAPIPNSNIGGFYDDREDMAVVSSNPKSWARHPAMTAHVLAHEQGHAELERDPVLRHTQGIPSQLGNPNFSHLPTLVAVLGGGLASSRAGRAASVAGGTLWNTLPLVAERHADDYARSRVLGTAKKEFHTPYRTMADAISKENQRSYHRGITRTGLLGLLAMGAREAYDHRDDLGRVFKGASLDFDPTPVFEKLRATSPVPVYHEDLPPQYGGFYHDGDPGVPASIVMNKVYKDDPDHTFELAHEIGHARYGQTPIGKVLQGGLHHYAWSHLPRWASFLSGALMPSRRSRLAGVLGSTAFAGVHPLNEHMADRGARKLLNDAGAPESYWKSTQGSRDANTRLALQNTKATGLIGLLGMGVREGVDAYRKAWNS